MAADFHWLSYKQIWMQQDATRQLAQNVILFCLMIKNVQSKFFCFILLNIIRKAKREGRLGADAQRTLHGPTYPQLPLPISPAQKF